MRKYFKLLSLIAVLATIISGCAKTTAKFNSNTINVTFAKSGPKFLTDDITVNPKDSIQFNYTVTCPTAMAYVTITKGVLPQNTDIVSDSVKTGDHRTFSAIHKLIADSIPGSYVYSVVARDINGVYLGASKPIVVTVTTDFNYYPNQQIYVPDTTAKTNLTYYSLSQAKAYSYTSTGAANSANIDFGYYYNPDSAQTAGVKKQPFGHTIYALNVSPTPAPISFYDLTGWTKNATVFKVAATPTFTSLKSGGSIIQGCLTNLKSGAVNSVPNIVTSVSKGLQTDAFTPLAVGNIIWFKTAAGKYGAMQIDYLSQNNASKSTFMTVDIKILK